MASRDAVCHWILSHLPLPKKETNTCFEIGCYPGRYLAMVGLQGYEVNGIDWTPGVSTQLFEWLCSIGCRVNTLYHQDFTTFNGETQYDVVYSIGFIEHFNDWQDIVRRHMRLVRPGGLLLITVPNFRGFLQFALHWLLDRPNLHLHNLSTMRPNEWNDIVKEDGFQIYFSGYFGSFDFWVDRADRPLWQNRLLGIIHRKKRGWSECVPDGLSCCAPYCGLVARRPIGGA